MENGKAKSIAGVAFTKKAEKMLDKHNREVKINPKSAGAFGRRCYAYMQLADAYMKLEEEDKAIKALNLAYKDGSKTIDLDPFCHDTLVNLGLVKEKLSNFKQASGDIDAAKKLLRDAIRFHNKAMELSPKSAHIYNICGNVMQSLAYLERKTKNWDQAEKLALKGMKHYDRAIELGHTSAYVSRAAAAVLLAMQKKDAKSYDQAKTLIAKALSDYDDAMELDISKPRLSYLRAEARSMMAELIHRHNTKEDAKEDINDLVIKSLDDYKDELKHDPEFHHAYIGMISSLYLGASHEYQMGNYTKTLDFIKQGRKKCEESFEIDPENSEAYYELGYLAFLEAATEEKKNNSAKSLKLLTEAIQHWRKSLEFCPDNDVLEKMIKSAEKTISEFDHSKMSILIERISQDKTYH